MPAVYNKKEAAAVLKISTETLDRYREEKKMPHRKIGDRVLFTEGDLIAFLDACAVPATCMPSDWDKQLIKKRAGGAA
jgi:excisionase family DNA binding protein